jgi:sarcosine oxidase subunit gamma
MMPKERVSMVEALMRDDPVPSASAVFAGVTITLVPPMTRFSLRTRDAEGLPARALSSAAYANGTALHLGPDEWLLLMPEGSEVAASGALTDVSHRNLGLTIEGPKAEALIQTGCALNLSPATFPVGKVTRTLFEGVELVLWRTSETGFHIELWRSFASHLWDALGLAADDLA